MQTAVPELVFSCEPATDDNTSREGFELHAALAETGEWAGKITSFIGYSLGERFGEEVIVEPDTLHIRWVYASAPDVGTTGNTPIRGIGTALVRQTIQHGVERGLTRGRTEPINARMISILGHLLGEGVISDLELYGGRPTLQHIKRLRRTGEPVAYEEAKRLLNEHSRPDRYQGASPNVTIRTLFALGQPA